MGDDYVEETMDENGHTMRKEVHKGNGWTSVEISGDISMAGGAVGNILQQVMQQHMQEMAAHSYQGGMSQLGTRPPFINPFEDQYGDEDDENYDDEFEEEEDDDDEYLTPFEMMQLMEQARRDQQQMLGPRFGAPVFQMIPMGMGPRPPPIPNDHAIEIVPQQVRSVGEMKKEQPQEEHIEQKTSEKSEAKVHVEAKMDAKAIEQLNDQKWNGLHTFLTIGAISLVCVGLYLFTKSRNDEKD